MKGKVIAKVNKRLWPHTNNKPLPRPLIPNDIIEIIEEVEGQFVTPQNNKWYKTNKNFYVWSEGVKILPEESLPKTVLFDEVVANPPLASRLKLNKKIVFDGKGVTIALLDTGLFMHSALEGKIDIENSRSFINGETKAIDDTGHGTSLAGIILGNDTSISGLSKNSNILNYRIASAGFVNSNAVFNALKNLVEEKSDTLDVINLSLDISSTIIKPIQGLVDAATDKGIIVVVAAGEDMDKNNIDALKNVVKVSVCTEVYFQKFKAGASHRDSYIFINSEIYSCSLDNKYQFIGKDSAYTAVMSGIIASLISSNHLKKDSSRLTGIQELLKEISFNIKQESTAVFYKPFYL